MQEPMKTFLMDKNLPVIRLQELAASAHLAAVQLVIVSKLY